MPPPTKQTSNASSWWEKSIVKRSTHSIENMVATMLEDSLFLRRHEQEEDSPIDHNKVLSLHRSNIQTGALLGKGSFSVVYEVRGLIEDRDPEHDCTFGTSSSSSVSLLDRQDLQGLEGRFAIKHLRPNLVQKPEMFQAAAADLWMEARYLSALNHPNIMKLRAIAHGGVSAYETTGGQYDGFFLIMDRLEGTLKDKILEWQVLQQDQSLLECLPQMMNHNSSQEEVKDDSTSSFPSTTVGLSEQLLLEKMDIARQIASALQYMHDRRLIFRDLKPPNVGLKAGNRVQLFDFGFCRELPSWGGESDANLLQVQSPQEEKEDDDALYYMSGKGSLMYLAPEVLYNGRYNRKADCYSFAMVLYELLTLNKPFHSVSGLEVFRELLCRHKARPPLEYSDIPVQLQNLLRHSWNDNIRERWNMRKISQRLQEISQELDPSFQPSSSHHQASNSDVDDQPILDKCGSGGHILDLLSGFASDIRMGYKILSGDGKVLEFQEEEEEQEEAARPVMECQSKEEPVQCRDPSSRNEQHLGRQLTGILTAKTEDSSIFSMDANRSLKITAMTATNEPLEVTLEEAMSPSRWTSFDAEASISGGFAPLTPCATNTEEHPMTPPRPQALRTLEPCTPTTPFIYNQREEPSRGLDDLRCPPSPPIQRTSSEPVSHSADNSNHNNSKISLSVQLAPHFPQRRQSMGSVKLGFQFLPGDPESPHYPQRRQSTGGLIVFPESHFLPTAAELRG